MRQALVEHRVYKPSRAASFTYMWDAVPLVMGMLCVAFSRGSIVLVVAGVVGCLLGVWQFCCSRNVLRTHFLVTQDEIISVGPLYSLAMRWEEVTRVLVRQRSSNVQIGRVDRLVILSGSGDERLPLNTSVLSGEQEKHLLEEIEANVNCRIERVTDRGLLPSVSRRREDADV